MKKFLTNILTRINREQLENLEEIKVLTAKSLIVKNRLDNIQDAEFKVFSQWGDDGIIQYLINYLEIKNKTFIEFGVEDYKESNTRFLLINNNWTGLVMDGSQDNINKIKNSNLYWKYNLKAKLAFVTAENINNLLTEENFLGEVGILHIDIDGNDYWVWRALEVVSPAIAIIEYNSVFGCERAITVPYDKDFIRSKKHYSNLYAGASIKALCDLATEKGYFFVGTNSAGNNAYFVRNDLIKDLTKLTPQQGYTESQFRESRDKARQLTFVSGEQRINLIKGMQVFNTDSKQLEAL